MSESEEEEEEARLQPPADEGERPPSPLPATNGGDGKQGEEAVATDEKEVKPKKKGIRFNDDVEYEDDVKPRLRFDEQPTEFTMSSAPHHSGSDASLGAASPDQGSDEDEKRSVGADSSINSVEANLYKRKMFSSAQRKFVKDVEKRVFKKDYVIMKAIVNVDEKEQDLLINPERNTSHDMDGRRVDADYSNLMDTISSPFGRSGKGQGRPNEDDSFQWESDESDSEMDTAEQKEADMAMGGTAVREKYERKRRMEDDIDKAIERREQHLIRTLQKMSDQELEQLVKDLDESIPMDKTDGRTVRSGKSRARSLAASRAATRVSAGASVKDQRYSRANVVKQLKANMSGSTLSTHTDFGNKVETNAAALNYAFLRKRQFELDIGLEVSTRDYELQEAVMNQLNGVKPREQAAKEKKLMDLVKTKQKADRKQMRNRSKKLVQRPWRPGGEAIETDPSTPQERIKLKNKAGANAPPPTDRHAKTVPAPSRPVAASSCPSGTSPRVVRTTKPGGTWRGQSAVGQAYGRQPLGRPKVEEGTATRAVRTLSPRSAGRGKVHQHRTLRAPEQEWPALASSLSNGSTSALPHKASSFLPTAVLALAALNSEQAESKQPPPEVPSSRCPTGPVPTRPRTMPPSKAAPVPSSAAPSFERRPDGVALQPPGLTARFGVSSAARAPGVDLLALPNRIEAMVLSGYKGVSRAGTSSASASHAASGRCRGRGVRTQAAGTAATKGTNSAEVARIMALQRCLRSKLFVALTDDPGGRLRGLEVRLRQFEQLARDAFVEDKAVLGGRGEKEEEEEEEETPAVQHLHRLGLELLDPAHELLECPTDQATRFRGMIEECSHVNAECLAERLSSVLDAIGPLRSVARQLSDGPFGAVLRQVGGSGPAKPDFDASRSRARREVEQFVDRCRAVLPWNLKVFSTLEAAVRVPEAMAPLRAEFSVAADERTMAARPDLASLLQTPDGIDLTAATSEAGAFA